MKRRKELVSFRSYLQYKNLIFFQLVQIDIIFLCMNVVHWLKRKEGIKKAEDCKIHITLCWL